MVLWPTLIMCAAISDTRQRYGLNHYAPIFEQTGALDRKRGRNRCILAIFLLTSGHLSSLSPQNMDHRENLQNQVQTN